MLLVIFSSFCFFALPFVMVTNFFSRKKVTFILVEAKKCQDFLRCQSDVYEVSFAIFPTDRFIFYSKFRLKGLKVPIPVGSKLTLFLTIHLHQLNWVQEFDGKEIWTIEMRVGHMARHQGGMWYMNGTCTFYYSANMISILPIF